MTIVVSVQYLRAMAAMMIVFHHIALEVGTPFIVAAAGVDLFFVISGFIMVAMTLQKDLDATQFLRNRAERIVPLYWMITLALMMPELLLPDDTSRLAATVQQLAASLLFIPQNNGSNGIFPAYIPGWTLNYEMFFYCLVAVSLRLRRQMRLPAILAMIGGLCLCGVLLRPQAAAPYVWTNPLLLEFAAGGILGMLWVRRTIPRTAIGLFLLCGGIGAYAALEALALHSEAWRFALWGGPAVMIVLGALSLEPAREPRLLRPLRVLGDASYSIYLLNLIVITCVVAAIGTDSPTLLLVLATLATIVSGIGCHRFFEQPAMRALRGARHAAHARKPATP